MKSGVRHRFSPKFPGTFYRRAVYPGPFPVLGLDIGKPVPVCVDHPGVPEFGFSLGIRPVDMSMTVKMIGGFEHFIKPQESFDPLVR